MFYKVILTVIIGYLLGCISAAYLIGKKFGHIDIRQYGSGNAGTTNMLRTMGIKYAAPTLLLDMLKAAAAALLGWLIMGSRWGIAIGGYAAVLGHTFPFYMDFKGGKGVAAICGVLMVLNPVLGIILLVLGILANLIVKIYSLVSIIGILVAAVCYTIFANGDAPTIVFAWVAFIQIVISHLPNIKRLLSGTESKMTSLDGSGSRKRQLR